MSGKVLRIVLRFGLVARASHAELSTEVGKALVLATLAPGETLAANRDHAIVACVGGLRDRISALEDTIDLERRRSDGE